MTVAPALFIDSRKTVVYILVVGIAEDPRADSFSTTFLANAGGTASSWSGRS